MGLLDPYKIACGAPLHYRFITEEEVKALEQANIHCYYTVNKTHGGPVLYGFAPPQVYDLIKIWKKTNNYAGMTLAEFLRKTYNYQSQPMAVSPNHRIFSFEQLKIQRDDREFTYCIYEVVKEMQNIPKEVEHLWNGSKVMYVPEQVYTAIQTYRQNNGFGDLPLNEYLLKMFG
jgi:hypothetical protein